jgi:hypothetical protein
MKCIDSIVKFQQFCKLVFVIISQLINPFTLEFEVTLVPMFVYSMCRRLTWDFFSYPMGFLSVFLLGGVTSQR